MQAKILGMVEVAEVAVKHQINKVKALLSLSCIVWLHMYICFHGDYDILKDCATWQERLLKAR